MDLEQIETSLTAALELRSPVLAPDDSSKRSIERLQDYMLLTAHTNGDLHAARQWLRAAEQRLGDEWRDLAGWEMATTKPRGKLTKEDVDACKRKVAPALFDAIRKARLLREGVVDQIIRLDREGDRMSRAYTMLAGA